MTRRHLWDLSFALTLALCSCGEGRDGPADQGLADQGQQDLGLADQGATDQALADQAPSPDTLPAGWDPAIGPYVRGLLVQSQASTSASPMAWSMINVACQDRTVALQYALASAADPGSATPPLMKEAELTNAHLDALIKNAPLRIGSVAITGPLIVDQTLTDAKGKPYTMTPWKAYWAYHHVPTVKLNGVWWVLDLSVSDYPQDLKSWAQQLVAADVTCQEVAYDAYQKVWSYWMTVLGSSWDPPKKKPSPYCAYYVSEKPFAWRPDQTPSQLYGMVRSVPSTMEVQLGGFKTLLKESSLSIPNRDIPAVLSLYEGKTLQELCTWADLKICGK